MNRYQVLWIDDDAEKQDGFLDSAYLNGLDINYYKTSKLGMEELVSKIEQYDAVILDAMVYNESEDEKAALTGLFNSIKKINSLSERKKIPYFIFSGYIDQDQHASAREMLANETIFIKSKDNKALFKAIKEESNKQEITQLKHKHLNPFSVCDDSYLGAKEFARVLQLIKDIENPENISNQQDALLPMRKVLEVIFKKLNSIGLIPDEIQNGSGAINGASFFLAGNNKDYNYKEELIHPVIAESIRHLLGLTQDASHNEGSKLGADTYLSDSINSYLYQSLCFSLLEVLEYIKPFLDSNSDKKINQSKWELKETVFNSDDFVKGKITKVAENGKGTFESIQLSSTISVRLDLMKEYKLKEGSLITITTKPGSSKTSKFINEIMKVN
jgi:hypothetical protein